MELLLTYDNEILGKKSLPDLGANAPKMSDDLCSLHCAISLSLIVLMIVNKVIHPLGTFPL